MKVAILIPTYNRPSFISRTVKYYDYLKSPHPIFIGDASNSDISKKTLSFLKSIKNIEVDYFNWQNLDTVPTISKLAEKASSKYNYCTFQGDDDYFIPSSLTQCAKFLSENNEYTTAQGRAAQVLMDSSEAKCNIKWIGEYWDKNSLEEFDKIERLLTFAKKYFVLQFSVHHMNHFLSASREASNIIDHYLYELLHCFMFAINGKSKFIDCLHLVRTRHENLLVRHYNYNLRERIDRKNWSTDYKKTIDSLSHLICDNNKISSINAKKIINKLINNILEKDCYKERVINNKKEVRKNVIIQSINIIRRYLSVMLLDKFGLRTIKNYYDKKNKHQKMRLWLSKGNRFHSKFTPIEKSLTKKN